MINILIISMHEGGFFVKIANLSDSETARDTYEKGLSYSPQTPAMNTTISQLKIDTSKSNIHNAATKDNSYD